MRKIPEKELYPIVGEWMVGHFKCFKSIRNSGLKYSRCDVVGIRDVGGDLSGEIETICIEVKKGAEPFATASGQALGYRVYGNRKTFVLVPQKEYRQLVEDHEPEMPTLGNDGTYPALPAVRVSIARTTIRRRKSAGMTRKALAEAAGIRVETLNRIEKAKVTADTATIARIELALKRASF